MTNTSRAYYEQEPLFSGGEASIVYDGTQAKRLVPIFETSYRGEPRIRRIDFTPEGDLVTEAGHVKRKEDLTPKQREDLGRVLADVLSPLYLRKKMGMPYAARHNDFGWIEHSGAIHARVGMPLYDSDLLTLLEDKKLSFKQRVKLARKVGGCLYVASGEGIAHNDIKPANVLIETSLDEKLGLVHEPKVADWGTGIAPFRKFKRELGGKHGIFEFTHYAVSERHLIYGSPGYITPEVGTSRPTPATNAFQFGILVLEALTGKNPFEEIQQDAIRQRIFYDVMGKYFPAIQLDIADELIKSGAVEATTAQREKLRDGFLAATWHEPKERDMRPLMGTLEEIARAA